MRQKSSVSLTPIGNISSASAVSLSFLLPHSNPCIPVIQSWVLQTNHANVRLSWFHSYLLAICLIIHSFSGSPRVCRPESALAHSPAFSPSHGLPLSSIAVDALYSESLTHSLPASELCALPYFLNQVLSLKVRPFHPSVIPVFIFNKSLTSLHYSEFPSTVPCWLGTQNKTLLTIICVCASIIESKLQAWHHESFLRLPLVVFTQNGFLHSPLLAFEQSLVCLAMTNAFNLDKSLPLLACLGF